jgi:hypothetical protein
MVYIGKVIPLPGVTGQTIEWRKIADGGETADGTYREDIVAIKKSWRLDVAQMSHADYKAVVDYLDSIMWGEDWFWLDEFGGTPETHSIRAFFSPERDTRSPHVVDGGWDNKGRAFGILVRQK